MPSLTRDAAIELARYCAAAKPQSYYSTPFQPHEWVVDAILIASGSLETKCARCDYIRTIWQVCPSGCDTSNLLKNA